MDSPPLCPPYACSPKLRKSSERSGCDLDDLGFIISKIRSTKVSLQPQQAGVFSQRVSAELVETNSELKDE